MKHTEMQSNAAIKVLSFGVKAERQRTFSDSCAKSGPSAFAMALPRHCDILWHDFWLPRLPRLSRLPSCILSHSMPSQSGCALKETVWKVTFHLNVNIYIDTFSKVCIYASNLLIMTVLEHAQTLFIMVLDNRWLSLYIKKHGLLLFQADDGLLSPCFGLSFCCNPYRKVLACWYHPFLALERA